MGVVGIPSRMSEIYNAYKEALDQSQKRYEKLSKERFENGKKFYNEFFSKLICTYSDMFSNEIRVENIRRYIQRVFNDTEVKFAAIDGTCYKKQMTDYMVFFGGSYAVRGTITLERNNPIPKYERWSSEQDTSFVTYIPIPFAELSQVASDTGNITGFDTGNDRYRIDMSNIHLQLMLLAEIFLAYDLVKTSSGRPKYILWDQSPSSILANTDIGIRYLSLIDTIHAGRPFQVEDAIVAYSKPWNEDLNLPSFKNFRIYNRVIYELYKNKGEIEIEYFIRNTTLYKEQFLKRIKNYLIDSRINDTLRGKHPIARIEGDKIVEEPTIRIGERWRYCRSLFEDICNQLFREKDTNALLREYNYDGEIYKRWLSPNDLKFIIAIGLRVLIEECWRNNVLLVGIVKDSASQYFTRNYLNVARTLNCYSFNKRQIPWTDRMYLETLPFIDEELSAPWSSIEFDSIFMTLNSSGDTDDINSIHGVKGNVVTSECLFLRSLAQFYLSRSKKYPSTGHVIFIDRIVVPKKDIVNDKLAFEHPILGKIKPLSYINCDTSNPLQLVNMYLLTILTRNLFPEVIGYPDPLHKADWGAKSIRRRVIDIIKSSELRLRMNPLKKRLRMLREEIKR